MNDMLTIKAGGSVLFDPYTDYKDAFARSGYVGPIRVMTAQQAFFLARHLRGFPIGRLPWEKSLAAFDPVSYSTASNADLIRLVRELIGDDVVLWGSQFIVRKPG